MHRVTISLLVLAGISPALGSVDSPELPMNSTVNAKRITPAGGDYFFGYYDVYSFSPDDKRHLSHRVEFRDRLPGEKDAATLGILDMEGKFIPFAETRAWCFQQGAMLQWVGQEDDWVFYNSVNADKSYSGIFHNLKTGERRSTDRALANLSRDGKWGLGINFDRMFDFRPGYGYCAKPDPWRDVNHPVDDGIYLVDCENGKSELILSLDRIWELIQPKTGFDEAKILINHITFNPSASRFLFLVRTTDTRPLRTAVYTCNRDGTDLFELIPFSMASHYYWTSDEAVLFWADGPAGHQLYLMKDRTNTKTPVDKDFFKRDGHCSTSPDGKWLLYDSYPSRGHPYRDLYLYHLPGKKGKTIGSFYSEPPANGIVDLRCDLHPRWNREGTCVSMDSTHENERAVYLIDLADAMRELEASR